MIEERLRQAFKQPGCPICAAVQEAHDTFYRWFVIETYGELPLLEDLSRGGLNTFAKKITVSPTNLKAQNKKRGSKL